MTIIQYDEFSGSSLESFWTLDIVSNAVRTIADGYHKTNITNSGGGFVLIGQEGIEDPGDGVLDITVKITIPKKEPQTGIGARIYAFLDFSMLDAGSDWSFLSYGYRNDSDPDTPAAGWYLEVYQDHNYPAYESDIYIDIGYHSTIWLRQRYADAEGFVRQFYSTTDPRTESDWIEVTPLDAESVMTWGADFNVQYYDGCSNGSEPVQILLDYFRSWPPERIIKRLRPRQLKFNGVTPVQVSDMKDGEIRVVGDRIYGRVGNQILQMDLIHIIGCGEYIGETDTNFLPLPQDQNTRWWGDEEMDWDGNKWVWDSGTGLTPLPWWRTGFRPSHIRVTYSDVGLITLRLVDAITFNNIVNEVNYVSGTEAEINWGDNDIQYLAFDGGTSAIEITGIEFCYLSTTTTTTTTTT